MREGLPRLFDLGDFLRREIGRARPDDAEREDPQDDDAAQRADLEVVERFQAGEETDNGAAASEHDNGSR